MKKDVISKRVRQSLRAAAFLICVLLIVSTIRSVTPTPDLRNTSKLYGTDYGENVDCMNYKGHRACYVTWKVLGFDTGISLLTGYVNLERYEETDLKFLDVMKEIFRRENDFLKSEANSFNPEKDNTMV